MTPSELQKRHQRRRQHQKHERQSSLSLSPTAAAFVAPCSAVKLHTHCLSASPWRSPLSSDLFNHNGTEFVAVRGNRRRRTTLPLLSRPRYPLTITSPNTTIATPTTACASSPSSSSASPSSPTPSSSPAPTTPSTAAVPFAPPASDIWELDFYSRPVVGLDGKKLWEVIIVDTTGTFEYVDAIPNTLVNSRELRKRIEAAIEQAVVKPRLVRFFRGQMANMIQIALSDVKDVSVTATRKTYMLYRVLQQRLQNVYTQMPGFSPSLAATTSKSNNNRPLSAAMASSMLGNMGFSPAQRLPDALRCEKFAFGNFPLGYLRQFFDEADRSQFYGDSCLDLFDESTETDQNGEQDSNNGLSDDLLIPGVVAFSKRAANLAAWINGIDLVFIRSVVERAEVNLECGLDNVYRFIQIDDEIREDVRSFQTMKEKAKGLHFLAIQETPESDEIEGLWLMCQF